jgi:hypothetical protein
MLAKMPRLAVQTTFNILHLNTWIILSWGTITRELRSFWTIAASGTRMTYSIYCFSTATHGPFRAIKASRTITCGFSESIRIAEHAFVAWSAFIFTL